MLIALIVIRLASRTHIGQQLDNRALGCASHAARSADAVSLYQTAEDSGALLGA